MDRPPPPLPNLGRWSSWRPRVGDGSPALLLAGVALLELAQTGPLLRPETVLALVQTLPLAWRRRRPLAVWLAVALGAAVWAALGADGSYAALFGGPIAVYAVAAYVGRPMSWLVFAATAIGVVAAFPLLGRPVPSVDAALLVAVVGTAWVMGDAARTHAAYTAGLEERAASLERSRQELARRIRLEERTRIARELHDVVAHHISMIAVQAETGPYLVTAGPEKATEGFAAIGETARRALTEMRRLLGVLRSEPDGSPALAPQPGFDDIPDLVAEVRQSGLAVDYAVRGEPRPLAAGVDLSAYRIVQEALTNVRRHAGPARAGVVVEFADRLIRLSVVDDGRGAGSDEGDGSAAGHGLVGIRERAAMLGGTVEAGPRPEGGYAMFVTIPLAPS